MIRDLPSNSIVKIGQNTEKSLGDLKKLADVIEVSFKKE